MDYCSFLLIDLPHHPLDKLQMAQNNSTHIDFHRHKVDHATSILRNPMDCQLLTRSPHCAAGDVLSYWCPTTQISLFMLISTQGHTADVPSLAQSFWSRFTCDCVLTFSLSGMAASPRKKVWQPSGVCWYQNYWLWPTYPSYGHNLCSAQSVQSVQVCGRRIPPSPMACSSSCPLGSGIDLSGPEHPGWETVSLLKQ